MVREERDKKTNLEEETREACSDELGVNFLIGAKSCFLLRNKFHLIPNKILFYFTIDQNHFYSISNPPLDHS